jgi:TolB protein
MDAQGQLRASCRIYDALSQKLLHSFALVVVPQGWRRLAHGIADVVYERLTGEKGYFNTKLAYVATYAPKNRRIVLVDQDGANPRTLTPSHFLALTPHCSAKGLLSYCAMRKNAVEVHIINPQTGKVSVLNKISGAGFAPRFSPDGKKLIYSVAKNGATTLYTYDLQTGVSQNLIPPQHGVIHTSPSYAPDGQSLVFNSDLEGGPRLYVASLAGGPMRRISKGGGAYYDPAWSPRGDYIAFITKRKGSFYLGVVRPDGTGERMIATDYFLEGPPTWCPNGRVLMFAAQSSPKSPFKLYTVDVTGHALHIFPVEGISATHPAWGH